ncbi:MAG: hypothetical protein KDB68_00250 [Planctomycetes bacterium]|nr:hypothetical protein [Planctomycetota bacterium]
MKFSSVLILLLLLVSTSCATSNPVPDANDGSFIAAETAEDAQPGEAPPPETEDKRPLTSDEEAKAALAINKLELVEDDIERNKIIEELVSLGPRYLTFFRTVDRDAVAMDMMFVIRRIERDNPGASATVVEAKDPENPEIKPDPKDPNPKEVKEGPTIPEYTGKLDDFNRVEVERFLSSRLEQARRLLDGGRYEQAQRIAEAAITLLPDTKLRSEFDALIMQARGESQSELLIAGIMKLEPGNVQYSKPEKSAPFVQPLTIRCFLKNVSASPITLRLFEGEGKESILQLSVTYEQRDYSGNAMSQTGTVRLPIDSGNSITLKPNDSYEIAVPLESLASLDSDAAKKYALGYVQIEAALRVYGAWNADGQPLVLRPVSFPTRSIYVYPAEFKLSDATSRPLTTMRNAIKDGRAQDLFMTAHLVESREKRSAGDLLVGDDFKDSIFSMQRARLKAMNVVFGTGKSWDIKRWREWWAENRLRQ